MLNVSEQLCFLSCASDRQSQLLWTKISQEEPTQRRGRHPHCTSTSTASPLLSTIPTAHPQSHSGEVVQTLEGANLFLAEERGGERA